MLFYGWGKRTVKKQIDNNQVLLCTYSYFSLMFVFMVTMNYKYKLAILRGAEWTYRDVTKEEAIRINSGEQLFPHWWWRFGLYIAVFILVFFGLLGSLLGTSRS